jgi:dual-specificity kinase
MQIIHTDIKLENLLFESSELKQVSFTYRKDGTKDYYVLPKTSKIKLIDFGNAVKATHPHPDLISTRAYRSPEVLLELGYSYETDVWSIGCVLLELFLGRPFFTSSLSINETENDLEQLNNFQAVLGLIPQELITNYKEEYYNNERYERIVPASSAVARYFKIESKGDREQFVLKKGKTTQSDRLTDLISLSTFYDLLRRTLEYKPSKRIKPMEALKHPFFK